MTDIQPQLLENKKRKSHRKNLRIDMTPMVDLGFLLVTFFIFTTTMGEKHVTKLVMPKESNIETEVAASKAVTVILGKDNKIYFYKGEFETAVRDHAIITSSYDERTGLGSLIRKKQQELSNEKDKLVLLIKPTKDATYENIINALDEAAINNVQRYAIVDVSKEEIKVIPSLTKQ